MAQEVVPSLHAQWAAGEAKGNMATTSQVVVTLSYEIM